MRLIDADALIEAMGEEPYVWTDSDDEIAERNQWLTDMHIIENAPTIEPNLILPERMERGDIYEVGETIVVMNHDDYYDLLCKSWVPKRGEWIESGFEEIKCSVCGSAWDYCDNDCERFNFCPSCGASMAEREGE